MAVSIMLTTIPRPPPGNVLFLQGKAWADKPWDSRAGTKSHPVASPPLTAVASSLFSPLSSTFSLFFPSFHGLPLLYSLPSSLMHYIGHTDGPGFSKWYLEEGGLRRSPGPLLSPCPQSSHLQKYPVRARFSICFCRGSKVQGSLIAFPTHLNSDLLTTYWDF